MSQLFDDAPQDTTPGATDGGGHGAVTYSGALFGGEENSAEAGRFRSGEGQRPGDPARSEGPERERAAPLDYAEFAVPEGMQVNHELMTEFKHHAAEMGLSQRAAQRLVDLQVKNAQAQSEAFHRMRADWRAEFPRGAADPVVQDAAYVLRKFDTDGGLARELAETGQGDNPRIIRFLAAVRREFREDAVHTGEDVKYDSRPLRERLWPDSTMPK